MHRIPLHHCIDHGTQHPQSVRLRAPPVHLGGQAARPAAAERGRASADTVYSFHGAQRFSGNGSHYVFSSTEWIFTNSFDRSDISRQSRSPRAGSPPASARRTTTTSPIRSVTIVSKLPDGRRHTAATAATNTASSSRASRRTAPTSSCRQRRHRDGPSHPLHAGEISASATTSRGAPAVRFAGMTKDGSHGLLHHRPPSSPADDNDHSADLYMWSEESDSSTRISQGNGNGDEDDCHAALGERLRRRAGHAGTAATRSPAAAISAPGIDDVMAEVTRRHLLLLARAPRRQQAGGSRTSATSTSIRDGEPQFVAAFDPGTEVDRMQVSPTGRLRRVWVTSSRMTAYDNDGFKEMYTYDADSRVDPLRLLQTERTAAPTTSKRAQRAAS